MMQAVTTLKKTKGISLRFFIVAGIFLFSLLLFIVITNEIVLENENNLDVVAFQRLKSVTNISMTRVMLFITFFGSNFSLLPAYIILVGYFLLFKKNKNAIIRYRCSGNHKFSLKAIFHSHRPFDPLVKTVNGFGFPSGHSFCSFTFFGVLIYILWNHDMNPVVRWIASALFFLFACAIALSRVYLHVHYASDVVAGFCLCAVWLGFSFWVMQRFKHKLS